MNKQPIFLTNTLSKQKEEFKPITEGKVSMYHCGPTVYWNQHIGNMRAVVVGDIVRRTFLYNGYDVSYVRNYTDVGHLSGDNIGDADTGEDRMEKAAKREALSPDEIADKYIATYVQDVAKMNTLPPTETPRATHFIPQMQSMIQTLIEKGFAYTTPTAIFFDISKFSDYTKLSRQDMTKLISGTGHGEVTDTNKKNPGDFALWFFKTGSHSNALQTWKSPFASPLVQDGEGFPGWHIECSSFIESIFGDTIDIHLGGIEHIPIHHTNEIAQSQCAHDNKPLATYWLHNAHLQVNNGKMSKSEGTSYLLSDIEEKGFDPLVLRYFFLQAHYRSGQNFTWEALEASDKALSRLKNEIHSFPNIEGAEADEKWLTNFQTSINNDFNTPMALSCLYEYIKQASPSDTSVLPTIKKMDTVLGLKLDELKQEENVIEISLELQELLGKRQSARDEKNWKLSDELRDQIKQEFGFEVKDTNEGQKLERV